jgi:hypothetical protein
MNGWWLLGQALKAEGGYFGKEVASTEGNADLEVQGPGI